MLYIKLYWFERVTSLHSLTEHYPLPKHVYLNLQILRLSLILHIFRIEPANMDVADHVIERSKSCLVIQTYFNEDFSDSGICINEYDVYDGCICQPMPQLISSTGTRPLYCSALCRRLAQDKGRQFL